MSRRPFAALLVAQSISGAGTRMSQLAVPWLVLTTTHNPIETGLVGVAEIAPYVVLQILGGPLIDQVGGHRVAVAGNAVAGAAMVAIPITWDSGLHRLPVLLALVFLAGLARGPSASATELLLPNVAQDAGLSIDRASAFFDGAGRTAVLIGAPLGGVLIGVMGAANVVFLDAASFVVAGLLLQLFVPVAAGRTHTAESLETETAGYLAELKAGFVFIVHHSFLRNIAGMVFFTNLADAAMSGLLLLLWVQEHYGNASRVGLISGCFAISAVGGTMIIAAYAARLPRRRTFALAFLFAGAPRFVVLAFSAPLWAIAVVYAVAGLSAGAINPLLGAAEFDAVPRPLQARVLGAVGALAWAGMPFGALLGGALVSATSLTTALTVGAVLYFVVTLAPFVRPGWAQMDRPADPVATGGVGAPADAR
jgi:MFS family permease